PQLSNYPLRIGLTPGFRLVLASIAGVLFVAAWAAATATAADNPCIYDDAAKTVTYAFPTGSSVPLVQRAGTGGEEIYIGTDGFGTEDLCKDPDSDAHATVTNTDLITLTGNPAPSVQGQNPRLEFGFKNGMLAPGATDEGNGSSEIEVKVPDPTGSFVIKVGRSSVAETSAANDHFLAGAKGINLNANETVKDLDVEVGSGSGALTGVVFYGGEGNDELAITGDAVTGGPTTSYNSLNGQDGNDTIDMTGTPDSFSSLTGGPGDDELTGNGLRGFDATSMNLVSPTAVTVDLSKTTPQTINAEQGTDTLSGIYNVYGGNGADTISGDAGVNWMGGNSSLSPTDGGDTIQGGGGSDQLSGGAGADHLFGGAGDDSLSGEAGADDLHGGADKDSLDGDGSSGVPSVDQMFGDEGDDRIELDEGDDSLNGGEGSDQIRSFGATGGLKIDLLLATTVTPGLGEDSLSSMEDVVGVFNKADTIKGNEGANKLQGEGGEDHLEGRGGNDNLSTALSGAVPTDLKGGAGDDILIGSVGPDAIEGGTGKDTISSSNGDDVISAPAEGEPDTVNCGFNNDTVTSFDVGLDQLTACENAEGGSSGGGGEGGGEEKGGGGAGGGGGQPSGSGGQPSGGGGGGTATAAAAAVTAPGPAVTGPAKKKPLKCKKGFRKKKVKGKTRCVKIRKSG
ncbi:MAG TPA: hypothetical protein VF085_04360, partial [Solirubrobacterales bacterium]